MKTVELYARVRHAVLIEGISERAAADRFCINARTVSKMLKFSVPPGYVRRKPPFRPKLDEFAGAIDAILATDKDRPKKQRHTSKRIFERLRDEHGFTGKITIVKDYVAGASGRRRCSCRLCIGQGMPRSLALNSAENRLRVLMVGRPLCRQTHLNRLSQKPGPPHIRMVKF